MLLTGMVIWLWKTFCEGAVGGIILVLFGLSTGVFFFTCLDGSVLFYRQSLGGGGA